MFTMIEKTAPGLGDLMKERTAFEGSRTTRPARNDDTLHAPRPNDGRVRGNYDGHVATSSLYTKAALNPLRAVLGAAALGLGIATVLRSRGD
jgi:hypothetical protein